VEKTSLFLQVIFSLWKIPDKLTSELMIEFYKQMIGGKDYANA
jgi:CHAT domain-containing protein